MRHLPRWTIVSVALLTACADKPSASEGTPVADAAPTDRGTIKLSGKCDATKVAALVGTLTAATAEAQSDLVAKHLGDACTLPESIAGFFAATAPGHEEAPLGRALDLETLSPVCPGAEVIVQQLAQSAGPERMGMLYERCKFDRFGVMTKGAWLAGRPSAVTPWPTYQWLLDQGVNEAGAKTIVTAMVMRDRKRWERPGQTLPLVTQAPPPPTDAPALQVTMTGIYFDSRKVVALQDGRFAAEVRQGHLVGPVYDRLAEVVDQRKSVDQNKGEDLTLVVVADASLPQSTLIDVLYTAGRAEFRNYAFLASTGSRQYGAIPVSPLEGEDDAGRDPALAVAISGADSDDLEALIATATQHKAAHPGATQATISATDDVTYGRLVAAMAAVYGVLPDITVSAQSEAAIAGMGIAGTAGILGTFSAGELGLLGSLGSAGLGTDEDVWGGLTGTEIGEAYGVGGLGLSGVGGAGGGSVYGTLSTRHSTSTRLPSVRQAKATVDGKLDKDIVRRIVRAHINEVRYCYNQGLTSDPTLEGKVTVEFTIDGTGTVSSATVESTTLADESVGECIAKAVKRWKFPKPTDGADTNVKYPFVLSPG